ncbi:MAG: hypothetical protein FJ308_22620 [Planctomycetes bacterium]|nr:hypothetical protein [Planctomycetota bacterium]
MFERDLIGAMLASEKEGAEIEMIGRLFRAHLVMCPLSEKFRGKSVNDTLYRLGFRQTPSYGSIKDWKSALWWANPKSRTERGRSQKGKLGKRVRTCRKQAIHWLRTLAGLVPQILNYNDGMISIATGICESIIGEAFLEFRNGKKPEIGKWDGTFPERITDAFQPCQLAAGS